MISGDSNPSRARVRISSLLYRLSRGSRDVEAVTSGKPERIGRRAKNKLLGRMLVRTVFRWLWR